VKIRARMSLIALYTTRTGSGSIILRMIFKLLPAMTFITIILILTTVLIFSDEIIGVPKLAGLWIIHINVWFSSIILPIMSIYALPAVMLKVIKGAPNSLIIKNIKIIIVIEVMNQFYHDIVFAVSEGTIWAIFTIMTIIGVEGAKLCFILIRAIQLFNLIVRERTHVPASTVYSIFIFSKFTKIARIISVASAILRSMIELTLFVIVLIRVLARL
jgi:hypothetical protein